VKRDAALEGRVALVTGGSRGIGRGIALGLAEDGADVAINYRRDEDAALETVAEIESRGRRAGAYRASVDDFEADRAMVEAVARDLGPVDILINNAGVSASAKFMDTTVEEWERIHRINATGPLLMTQAFLPGMLEQGWGRIVNVASIASFVGDKYISAYAASKHALMGMTRSLAAELVGTGVTANTVCPGYVDTPMTDANIERIAAVTGRERSDIRRRLQSGQPGGRLITPEEVAHAVLTFLPQAAAGLQGSSLVLDGGGLRR